MKNIDIYENMDRIELVLKKVGTLSIAQAEALNFHNSLAKGAIRQLVKDGRAFYSKDRDFIMVNPKYKPRAFMEDAVNVMLPFLGQIHIENIYRPYIERDKDGKPLEKTPIILGFVRRERIYEVCKAKDRNELKNLAEKLEKRYQKDGGENQNIRYLIALPRESSMKYMPTDISFPYAFAIMKYDNDRNCDITFVSSDRLSIAELDTEAEDDE